MIAANDHEPDVSLGDSLTWQTISHELTSIPNQIDKNITRTAFSPLINEYKDYAVGMVDRDGRLVSQSRGSLLIFAANALGTAVADGLKLYGAERLALGDVLISNHSGTLGQHLNNVVMYTPIRETAHSELLGFFCVLMHWVDIGGMMVGSCSSTTATEIYQEGIQFRSVKLVENGVRRDDMFRMIEYNTRFPEMLLGDVEAQLSACLKGRSYVQEIVQKYGSDMVLSAIDDMWNRAELHTREVIRNTPDGIYKASSFLDADVVNGGATIPINVEVRIQGDQITVDLSGVAPQLSGPINAGRNGGAVACARIAVKFLFSPETPLNEGDFRPLTVEIPEGTFLSAGSTAAMGSSGHMIPSVVDTILRAMQLAFPDRAAAAHHGTYGVHAFHGRTLTDGASFYHVDTSVGGWGATRHSDGYGPSRSIVHGDTSDVPVEMQEALYPFRFDSYALRTDSAGAGRRRGGLGVVKTYHIEGPCRVNLKFDRTQCGPWGVDGGQDAQVSGVEIQRMSGKVEKVLTGDCALSPGDKVIIKTAGGGGFGPAHEREIELVRQDVELGYVSPDEARRLYRVSVDSEDNIDSVETAVLRSEAGGWNG